MNSSLKEEELELIGGSGSSPFRSLSLMFQGFCDPEGSVRNCEEDDDVVHNGFQQNGISPVDRQTIYKSHADQDDNVQPVTKRAVMPSKYLDISQESADSTSQMTNEEEVPSLVRDLSESNNVDSLTEEKEVLDTTKVTALDNVAESTLPVIEGDSEPVREVSRCLKTPEDENISRGSPETKSRSIDLSDNQTKPESILGNKKGGFDVVADSGRKKRVNRIVDTAFYSLLGVILTILFLRMNGKVVFDVKPVLPADGPSSPINFDIKKEEAIRNEDIVSSSEDISEDILEDTPIEQQSCDTDVEGQCVNKDELNDDEEDQREELNVSQEA